MSFHRHRVGIIVSLVNYASKLVEACEASQSIQMPKMVALVKQLKKELDINKVIKEKKTKEQIGELEDVLPTCKVNNTIVIVCNRKLV